MRAMEWVGEHRAPMLWSMAAVIGPPLLAVSLHSWRDLDGFDHTRSHPVNDQIAVLLHGEQLVPPPPLPPEVFSTPEIERARPLVGQASRQWELLDAEFRQRLLLVFRLMRDRHGYEMVLLEGYRSPERQARLASLGPQVTQAGAFRSYHQFGLAADCAFLRDGRIVLREDDPWAARAYAAYGDAARSAGLTWGGNWTRLKDLGHVESPRDGVLAPDDKSTSPGAHAR